MADDNNRQAPVAIDNLIIIFLCREVQDTYGLFTKDKEAKDENPSVSDC